MVDNNLFFDPQMMNEFAPDEDGTLLVDAMGAQAQGQLMAQAEADMPPEPPPKMTFDSDGTFSMSNVGPLTAQRLQKYIQLGQQQENYLNQAIAQAMQKKRVLEEHPIIAQLGRTLSGVAANYSAPGSRGQAILRGVGAFGSEFFQDTPESLLQRAAQLQNQKFQTEGQIINQLEDQERFRIQEERARRDENRSQRQLDIAENRLRASTQDDFMRVYEKNAGEGEDEAEAFKIAASARPDLFKPEEIESRYKALKLVTAAAVKRKDREEAKEMANRMWELQQRRADRAANLAAGRYETQARLYLGNISTANAKLAGLYNDQTEAKSFFGAVAARMGVKEPTSAQEAKDLLAKAIGKEGIKLGPELQEKALTIGFKLSSALDISAQEKAIKANLRAYKSRLPGDLRTMIEEEPTPAEITTDPTETGKPQVATVWKQKMFRWLAKSGDSPANRARFVEMEKELLSGKIPQEFQLNEQAAADEGPIRAFESAVGALKPDEKKAAKRREAWKKFWVKQLSENQATGSPVLRRAGG